MKTELHNEVDGLLNALRDRGVEVKRSDVIESLAKARGHRNAHEMMAAAKESVMAADEHPFAEEEHVSAEDIDLRHALRLREIEIAQLRDDIDSTERRSNFDWVGWNKTIKAMKKASHHRKDPISDEDLLLLRMAVSDNHCKSSSSERASARYRVQELAEKRMAPLLARLDQAEELLGKGEVITGPVLDALGTVMQVRANRDGDEFDCYFLPNPDHELDEDGQGVMLAAKAYSIDDLHTLHGMDEDATLEDIAEDLRADMDSCHIEPADVVIDVRQAVEALRRGEGSVLLHSKLIMLAAEAGLDPRERKGIIYPKMEG